MQPRVAGAMQLALPDAKEVEPFDDVGRLVGSEGLDGAGEERSTCSRKVASSGVSPNSMPR